MLGLNFKKKFKTQVTQQIIFNRAIMKKKLGLTPQTKNIYYLVMYVMHWECGLLEIFTTIRMIRMLSSTSTPPIRNIYYPNIYFNNLNYDFLKTPYIFN